MSDLIPSYEAIPLDFTTPVAERRVVTSHRVVYVDVPDGADLTVRFGQRTSAAWPLRAGLVHRFCFPGPPKQLFFTGQAPGVVTVVTSEEVLADFFSGAGGASLNSRITSFVWPPWITSVNTTNGDAVDLNTTRLPQAENVTSWAVQGAAPTFQRRGGLPGIEFSQGDGLVWVPKPPVIYDGASQGVADDRRPGATALAVVYAMDVLTQATPVADGVDTGWLLLAAEGPVAGYGLPSGGVPFCGVRPTAAGGIQYIERRTQAGAVVTLDLTAQWPVPLSTSARLEYWVVAARGAADGRLEVYVDGLLLVSRTGAQLPEQFNGAGGQYRFLAPRVGVRADVAETGLLWMGPQEYFLSIATRGGSPL